MKLKKSSKRKLFLSRDETSEPFFGSFGADGGAKIGSDKRILKVVGKNKDSISKVRRKLSYIKSFDYSSKLRSREGKKKQ